MGEDALVFTSAGEVSPFHQAKVSAGAAEGNSVALIVGAHPHPVIATCYLSLEMKNV